ncbi:UNVERIFIED_CONTAM: hypothetical protein RMT77_018345 [Armadillidium vulgare]
MANSIRILYDIRRDILQNDDVTSLKKLSFFIVIPRFFTPYLLQKYSILVYPEISYQECKDRSFKKYRWEQIEVEVAVSVKRFIGVSMDREIDEVIHFISNQIFLFLSKNHYSYNTVINIFKNIVFTWQGTINLEETFENVIFNANLTRKVKFEIACKNFLDEEILTRYMLLTDDDIFNYLEEDPIVEENIPVYFWLCQFQDYIKKIEKTCFQNIHGEFIVIYFTGQLTRSSTDYIFLWALFTYNDLAVEHIWRNYISIVPDRYQVISIIYSIVFSDFRMANCIIYLLTEISELEFEIFFQVRSILIFKYLLEDLKWQSSFLKVLDVLHTGFEVGTHIAIFKYMISMICSDYRDKFKRRILREFLSRMPFEAKWQFLVDNDSLYYDMLQSLYNNNDLESCSVLLEIGGPLNENNLFSTNLVTILFDKHIFSGKLQVIDNLLKFYFDTTYLANRLKKRFFDQRALYICQTIFSYQTWENLKLFINWCLKFVSLREVILLKSDILLVDDGKLFKKLIFQDQDTDDAFQHVDEVLVWCLHSKMLINYFKGCLVMVKEAENDDDKGFQKINCYAEIRECVSKLKFPFLSRFFKWRKCSDEEINEIKSNLLVDEDFYALIFRKRTELNFFPLFALMSKLDYQQDEGLDILD